MIERAATEMDVKILPRGIPSVVPPQGHIAIKVSPPLPVLYTGRQTMHMGLRAPPRPFRRVPFRQIGHHRMREREVDVEEDPAGMGKAIPLTRLDAAHLIRLQGE